MPPCSTGRGIALAANRDRLIEVMAAETGKTIAEADPEVSEAVDFAHYYAARARELDTVQGARFVPVARSTVVTPPWNFPVAIPAGSVLAALAAGSGVIIKPAPQARRTGAVMVEALWEAGIPRELLALVDVDENDLGQQLVADPRVDRVILTGLVRDGEAVPLVAARPAAARRDERQERDHRHAECRLRPRRRRHREERLRARRAEVLGREPGILVGSVARPSGSATSWWMRPRASGSATRTTRRARWDRSSSRRAASCCTP